MSGLEHEPHAPLHHAAPDAHDSHGQEALGPLDWQAWAMAVAGGALAAIVGLVLILAAHPA